MTHPVREENREFCRSKSTPFDPEDLSRRLAVVLAKQEQYIQHDQRRNRRAVSETTRLAQYVPQVAAADFARTTTQDVMNPMSRGRSDVHKLAEAAIRQQQKSSLNNIAVMGGVRQSIANDRARAEKQVVMERNQFQWDRNLEGAAELDKERDLYRLPQRTLTREPTPAVDRINRYLGRPMSTGDLLNWETGVPRHPSKPRRSTLKPKASQLALDHHDWAQRDETTDKKQSPTRKILNWSIRRKSSQGNEETTLSSPSTQVPSASPGKRKNSLLARLRRWEY